jgi:mannosyltransferase
MTRAELVMRRFITGAARGAGAPPAAPAQTAAPGLVPAARPSAAAARRLPDWTLIAGPGLTLAVMLWGVGARPYWGDEADTVSAVSRSVPQLVRLLGHIDAVHGLYYLMLWPVARIAGTGEVVTRLPSAAAMAAAAAGVAAIARRLASRRAAACAGLVFAALPTVTIQGHDARPYAAVTAAAALASYMLVRVTDDPRPPLLAGYGIALAAVGYLQLLGMLLVPAHAVTLACLARRQPARPCLPPAPDGWPATQPRSTLARAWLVTVVAAGLAVTPVAILGWVQRAQIAWIHKPGWDDLGGLVATLSAGSAAAIVIGLLAVAGGVCGAGPARLPGRGAFAMSGPSASGPGRGLAWLAVPWLVLPPVILLAASEIKPVYFSRYVTFCVPAAALMAGAGLAAFRLPARAAAAALLTVLVAPAQLALRVPGGGMQAVAQFLGARERPGDAIVYPQGSVPPWYLAYPGGFGRLRDLSLSQAPAAAGRLYGSTVPQRVLFQRERGACRIWLVLTQGSRDPAAYLAPGFGLAHEWTPGGQVVLLYTRPAAGPAP